MEVIYDGHFDCNLWHGFHGSEWCVYFGYRPRSLGRHCSLQCKKQLQLHRMYCERSALLPRRRVMSFTVSEEVICNL
jgi:hypothetical protein